MNCVKIVADDQKSSIEVSGTPLDCFCIMGSVTVNTLAKIIPDMPCRPETAINSFGSTLMEQLRKSLRRTPARRNRRRRAGSMCAGARRSLRRVGS